MSHEDRTASRDIMDGQRCTKIEAYREVAARRQAAAGRIPGEIEDGPRLEVGSGLDQVLGNQVLLETLQQRRFQSLAEFEALGRIGEAGQVAFGGSGRAKAIDEPLQQVGLPRVLDADGEVEGGLVQWD